jgi:hypothetical protein
MTRKEKGYGTTSPTSPTSPEPRTERDRGGRRHPRSGDVGDIDVPDIPALGDDVPAGFGSTPAFGDVGDVGDVSPVPRHSGGRCPDCGCPLVWIWGRLACPRVTCPGKQEKRK